MVGEDVSEATFLGPRPGGSYHFGPPHGAPCRATNVSRNPAAKKATRVMIRTFLCASHSHFMVIPCPKARALDRNR